MPKRFTTFNLDQNVLEKKDQPQSRNDDFPWDRSSHLTARVINTQGTCLSSVIYNVKHGSSCTTNNYFQVKGISNWIKKKKKKASQIGDNYIWLIT